MIIAALFLASFTMLAGNVKADNTSEVLVVSSSRYVASSTSTLALAPGDLIVVGEIRNIGTNVIGNVTVQGTAMSASGQTLAITSSQAFVYYLSPGHNAPFYLDFTAQSSSTQDLSWVASVNLVTVSVTSVTDVPRGINSTQYDELNVVHASNYTDPSTGVYFIRGVVENDGPMIAESPWVVTTFYDATGTVIGFNYTDFLAPSLSPNGGLLFYAAVADNNTQITNEIAHYTFQVDSLTLTNLTASTTPTPTSGGSSSPAGQFPILPIVLVVVLVVLVVVALMLFRTRKKSPLPPPPPTQSDLVS